MAFEGFAELLSNTHGMKFRKYKAAGDTEAQAAALFPAVVDSLVDHYYGFVMQSVTGMHKAARNQRFNDDCESQHRSTMRPQASLVQCPPNAYGTSWRSYPTT